MARSINICEHVYILESDRSLPESEQTFFHLIPRTVRDTTESAARYAKVTIENKRKRRTEIDSKAMQNAEEAEWLVLVKKIRNFLVTLKAPDKAFDHFSIKSESDGTKYSKCDEGIIVVDTEEQSDLLYIYRSMNPVEVEEIVNAGTNYSILKEGEKNV